MTKIKRRTFCRRTHKPLLATALTVAGVFSMVSAVIAEGTPAGADINNTATATYSDGTTNFQAISNTVTIKVAEVAGLTVTQSGFRDNNDGSIVNGDAVAFDFKVTNTGNANTYVFVPGASSIVTAGGTISKVEIVNPVTNTVIATVSGPTGLGDSTQNLTNVGAIAPNANFTVRVTMTVTATNVGDKINVQFGDTADEAPNTNPTADQNRQNILDGTISPRDVRTIKIGGAGPVNGEREAADFREESFATSAATKLAQATLLKSSAYNDSGTASNPIDDKIAYGLELRVGNQTFPGVAPGNLEGTNIRVKRGTAPAAVENRILVSDAVPAQTVFDASVTPSAPPNWEVVYSTDDPVVTGNNPLQATWTTVQPAPAAIKRVGFIYNAATNGTLAPTTTVSGFSFTVVTSGLPASGGTIANIAQIFGETENDTSNNLVYDESGDQQFNNFDNGAPPPTTTATTFDPINDKGIANANDPDPGNNTGTTPKGESNVVTITATVIPPSNSPIFNGPNGAPKAVGPTNNNNDFTNVAVPVSVAGIQDATTGTPGSVTVTNQVTNPVGAATQIDNVKLLPLSPTAAAAAADLLDDGIANASFTGSYDPALPNNTKITIAYNGQSAVYVYTAANGFSAVGTPSTPPTPVSVGTLTPGQVANYTVKIELPPGTPQIRGYGVPIVAFVDNNNSGTFEPVNENVANITIDRVYTGFMTLFKEASVDGVTFVSSSTALAALQLKPGDKLFYRIAYKNISEAASGGGNILLNASNFVIEEDGNATVNGTANNWAGTTLHQNGTTRSSGTVEYFNLTTSLGTTDPADNAVVTKYRNTVGTVTPGQTGELKFIRKLQ